MPAIETEVRKLKLEMKLQFDMLRKMIVTRLVADKWVQQDVACVLLNVKPRQLRNVRRHLDKDKKITGSIGWKKGTGKNVLYYAPDIEKYNSAYVIMN